MPPLRLYVDPGNSKHDPIHMPDRPTRITACLSAIESARIGHELIEPRAASTEELGRVHHPGYLGKLEQVCARGGGLLDPDTPAGPDSFVIAIRAAGACCSAVGAALDKGVRSFCLIRPPGHHATAAQAMGFCLINNVAVGARHAIARGASKVAVVDFDVHHGNGTQEIFWEDPTVLYVSIHQWPWYPWATGSADETGSGPGRGTNLNVPLDAGSGDEAHLEAIRSRVAPAVRRFGPDMLLVSGGFDAHLDDPLSDQRVTAKGFGEISTELVGLAGEVCEGRLMMALEGGYNPDALSESVVETLRAF
ncbi:MAG: histone deacetylase family protein [Actinomycetota bacterium]